MTRRKRQSRGRGICCGDPSREKRGAEIQVWRSAEQRSGSLGDTLELTSGKNRNCRGRWVASARVRECESSESESENGSVSVRASGCERRGEARIRGGSVMKHELKGRAPSGWWRLATGGRLRAHSQRAQGVREEKLRAKKLHRTQNMQ